MCHYYTCALMRRALYLFGSQTTHAHSRGRDRLSRTQNFILVCVQRPGEYECHGCTFPAETHCHHTTDAVRKVSTGCAGRHSTGGRDTPRQPLRAPALSLSLCVHLVAPTPHPPSHFSLELLDSAWAPAVEWIHGIDLRRLECVCGRGVWGDGSSALMAGQLPEEICQPGRGWRPPYA